MLAKKEITENLLTLLSEIELPKVSESVCQLVKTITGSSLAALFFWDSDLDILTHGHLCSEKNRGEKFLKEFAEKFQSKQQSLYLLEEESFRESIPESWQPLYCYEIYDNNGLCACVLFTVKPRINPEELMATLSAYPLPLVLKRAWEFSELAQENERLRDSYEEMEDKTRTLEEQTRKLIQDLTMKDSIRTRHLERERLIYLISNVVRSYVDIQRVLETTVEKIGSTFALNRCLLIHSPEVQADTEQMLQVFEFTQGVSSIKEKFNSDQGRTFANTAFGIMRTLELSQPFSDLKNNFDSRFLQALDFRSALLIPLLLRERCLGVLFLQDCIQPKHWSIDDISLIGSLADQISVAIENAELHLEQERQAITDGLTSIANRRSFSKTLTREFERAKRYEQPLSLIILDLDYLKIINDNFGHQIGDEAIKAVARVLKQSSRAIDLAARYGGEEFCLLLPNTELAMAEQLAERLRKLINNIHIEGPGHISASLGIASYPLHANDPDILFRVADAALYEAKLAGRNRVKVANKKA